MSKKNGSRQLERFKAFYKQAQDQGQTGDMSLDMFLITSSPETNEFFHLLSVPHWFNENVIGALSPRGISRSPAELLEELSQLSFVRPHRRGLVFHDNVRKRLRINFAKHNLQELRQVSVRLMDFFGDNSTKDGDESLLWEAVYHQIAADEIGGLGRFDELFSQNRRERRFTACYTLAEMLAEQQVVLSPTMTPWIDYYRGLVLFDGHRWKEARDLFHAFDVEELPTPFSNRIALYQGLTAEAHEDWDEAERTYTEAAQRITADSAEDIAMAARLYERLAQTKLAKQDLLGAEEQAKKSLSLNQSQGDVFGRALSLRTLGRIQTELRDGHKAKEAYEQSIAALDEVGREFAKATVYTDLARLAVAQQDFVAAEEYYNKAIDLKAKGGDNFGLAILYLDLGNLKLGIGDTASALRLFDRSLSVFRRFNDSRNMAKALYNIAMSQNQSQNTAAATKSLRDAIRLLREEGASVDEYEAALKHLEDKKGRGRKLLNILGIVFVILVLIALTVLMEWSLLME